MSRFNSKKIAATGVLLVGLIIGATAVIAWLEPGSSLTSEPRASGGGAAAVKDWTCSMHPQIRMDHPGICPLCGMDLTPVSKDNSGPEELSLSEYGRMIARVTSAEVTRRELYKELRTVGRVEPDETRVAKISAWIDGRVDKVYANFPGTVVKKGDHLVSIYSPDLFSTQEEFLLSFRHEQEQRRTGAADKGLRLSDSARKRLRLWGITEPQIDELARSGKAQTHLVVYAPMGGTVIEKSIRDGQYVKTGDVLYLLADLSRVWLVLELYESELSWIRVGQAVEVTLESEPQKTLTGAVAFVEPVLNEATRTVKVRVILHNPERKLRPGMFAEALLRVPILPGGQPAPTGLEGKYVCPMHPYEFSDQPGECPECHMPLEKSPNQGDSPHLREAPPGPFRQMVTIPFVSERLVLAVPAEAVLTTGRRELVYVEDEPGKYRVVAPKLGPRAGDYYPVFEGLKEGDRVVIRGNFLLDSQFQITGKPSLLYPVGATAEMNLAGLSAKDRELAMAQRTCPVTGALLGSMGTPVKVTLNGKTVFLCCKSCEAEARQDDDATVKKLKQPSATASKDPKAEPKSPAKSEGLSPEELANIDKLPPEDREAAKQQQLCPITDMPLGSMGTPVKMTVKGRTIFLCCQGCEYAVRSDPDGTLKKLDK